VLSLILAALFFAGIHLGIAGTAIRDRAIRILGENGYRGAFAIASVVGLGWLVAAYNRAPYLATWGMLEWWKPIAIVLMLPASLLVVIGLTTPNPTSVAQEGRVAQPPRGIVRITRHPFLTGVGLWALLHLISNGDVASLVFSRPGRSWLSLALYRSMQSVGGSWGTPGSRLPRRPRLFLSQPLPRGGINSFLARSGCGAGPSRSSPMC